MLATIPFSGYPLNVKSHLQGLCQMVPFPNLANNSLSSCSFLYIASYWSRLSRLTSPIVCDFGLYRLIILGLLFILSQERGLGQLLLKLTKVCP